MKITSVSTVSEKPLKRIREKAGIRKNARPEMIMMRIEKKENILLMKLLSASGLSDSFSMINGIRTERDTTEATVTKIRSGIRKAA